MALCLFVSPEDDTVWFLFQCSFKEPHLLVPREDSEALRGGPRAWLLSWPMPLRVHLNGFAPSEGGLHLLQDYRPRLLTATTEDSSPATSCALAQPVVSTCRWCGDCGSPGPEGSVSILMVFVCIERRKIASDVRIPKRIQS